MADQLLKELEAAVTGLADDLRELQQSVLIAENSLSGLDSELRPVVQKALGLGPGVQDLVSWHDANLATLTHAAEHTVAQLDATLSHAHSEIDGMEGIFTSALTHTQDAINTIGHAVLALSTDMSATQSTLQEQTAHLSELLATLAHHEQMAAQAVSDSFNTYGDSVSQIEAAWSEAAREIEDSVGVLLATCVNDIDATLITPLHHTLQHVDGQLRHIVSQIVQPSAAQVSDHVRSAILARSREAINELLDALKHQLEALISDASRQIDNDDPVRRAMIEIIHNLDAEVKKLQSLGDEVKDVASQVGFSIS